MALRNMHSAERGNCRACAGTLVSTCFFQLWLAALVLGAVLIPVLHPSFWALVGDNIGWVISFFIILAWHILSQLMLNRVVTDGKRIKRPFVWLFLYIGLSTGYCVVRPCVLRAARSATCALCAAHAACYACWRSAYTGWCVCFNQVVYTCITCCVLCMLRRVGRWSPGR